MSVSSSDGTNAILTILKFTGRDIHRQSAASNSGLIQSLEEIKFARIKWLCAARIHFLDGNVLMSENHAIRVELLWSNVVLRISVGKVPCLKISV